MTQIGRNAPCPCGSGKKYKHCCGRAQTGTIPAQLPLNELFLRAQQAQGQGLNRDAAAMYEAILAREPGHADATHYLGMTALQAGNLSRAQELVSKSLELNPNDGFFWMNQGLIHQHQNELERAVEAYRKATKLIPAHPVLWFNLGNVPMQLRWMDEAIDAFKRSIALQPSDWQVWMNLGTSHMLHYRDEQDSRDALACFDKAIKLAPTRGEAYNGKGLALMALDRREEALQAVQEAVRVDPKLANGWFNLARLHLDLLDVDSAVAAYQQAVQISPDTTEFYAALGDTFNMVGKFDKAQEFFAKANALNPNDLNALAQLISNKDTPLLLAQAEASVNAAKDDDEGVATLLFALGHVYDRKGQFDLAFGYFERANRIRSREEVFDRDAHARKIDALISAYSAERIAQLKQWGNPSDQPVLIVGMPRSGTTLTEQIISSHSQVLSGGERAFWFEAARKIEQGSWTLDREGIAEIAQACLADLATLKGAEHSRRVTDKLPDNFQNVGLIHSVFPNARIIHCRRNPVDNCLSNYFVSFTAYHPHAYDLDDLAFYHLEYQRLMAHWRKVIPADRLFEFDYEALVADQEGMSRKLLEFVGLDWEDACLNFDQNENVVRTASIRQVREKMYTRSVERWRNYEPYILPLLKLLPGNDGQEEAGR
jgi:tetratricopeptide (TPR) repeat protein